MYARWTWISYNRARPSFSWYKRATTLNEYERVGKAKKLGAAGRREECEAVVTSRRARDRSGIRGVEVAAGSCWCWYWWRCTYCWHCLVSCAHIVLIQHQRASFSSSLLSRDSRALYHATSQRSSSVQIPTIRTRFTEMGGAVPFITLFNELLEQYG